MAVTRSFAAKVASQIGAPADIVFSILNQWQPHEGGSASFNPLNTTQGGPGVTGNYNSVGVKNFDSENSGATATAATLLNGYYPDIVSWMRTGQLSNPQAVAQQVSKWGTTGFANQIAGGGSSNVTTPAATNPSDMSDYQDFLDTYVGPRPKKDDYPDVAGYDGKTITGSGQQAFDTANKAYAAEVKAATAGYASYRTAIGKGVTSPDQLHQQATLDLISALNTQVQAGQLDATQAQSKLLAFINEQKNALDLGQQQLTANAEVDKYGPGGDWSYNQLGDSAQLYAKMAGIDPASSGLKFTTPTPFDPAAAYQTNIGTMGGGGGPPGGATPGAASTAVAALIAGMQGGGGSDTAAPPATIQPQEHGFFGGILNALGQNGTIPPAATGGQATIAPPGVDQNGNPVAPPPSRRLQPGLISQGYGGVPAGYRGE